MLEVKNTAADGDTSPLNASMPERSGFLKNAIAPLITAAALGAAAMPSTANAALCQDGYSDAAALNLGAQYSS